MVKMSVARARAVTRDNFLGYLFWVKVPVIQNWFTIYY